MMLQQRLLRGSFYCRMIEWPSCLACKSSFSVCLLKILCSRWYFGKHLMMMPKDFLPRFVLTFESHEGLQGCPLAKPGGPWCQTFALGQLENLRFFRTNHMLGTLDFTGSVHWAPFSFSKSTVLGCTMLSALFCCFSFFFLLLLKSWAL